MRLASTARLNRQQTPTPSIDPASTSWHARPSTKMAHWLRRLGFYRVWHAAHDVQRARFEHNGRLRYGTDADETVASPSMRRPKAVRLGARVLTHLPPSLRGIRFRQRRHLPGRIRRVRRLAARLLGIGRPHVLGHTHSILGCGRRANNRHGDLCSNGRRMIYFTYNGGPVFSVFSEAARDSPNERH